MALCELWRTWMLNRAYGLMGGFVLKAVFPVCICIFNFLHSVIGLWQICELHSGCFVGYAILLPLVLKHIKKPKFCACCIVPILLHVLDFKRLSCKLFFSNPETKHHFTRTSSFVKNWTTESIYYMPRHRKQWIKAKLFALKFYF